MKHDATFPAYMLGQKTSRPYINIYIHDQLKIRPYFLPLVSKNRRYRILDGIDQIGDFLKNIEPRSLEFCRHI